MRCDREGDAGAQEGGLRGRTAPPLVGPSGELEKVLAGEGSVSGLDHQITQEARRGLGGLFCFLVEKKMPHRLFLTEAK